MSLDFAAESRPVTPEGRPLGSAEIRRLLVGYASALETAEALPAFIRPATRPRAWLALDSLRRFPRPTFGTYTMVLHHTRRTSAELSRR